MSEDWTWFDEIVNRVNSENVGEFLFSPVLQNFQSEMLIACIKEMRAALEYVGDVRQINGVDYPGSIFIERNCDRAQETLNHCARGEFEK